MNGGIITDLDYIYLALRRVVVLGMRILNSYCNCMISTWQPVRVVNGDGHIRSLAGPVTVRKLVEHHPHHFVCEPTSNGPVYHNGMLPLDMELEEARMYLLLPLPRLLPHLDSTFRNPPSCRCFDVLSMTSEYSPGYEPMGKGEEDHHWHVGHQGQLVVVAAKRMHKLRHRIVKSKLMRSLLFMSQRMLLFRKCVQNLDNNDLSKLGSDVGKSVQYSCSRSRWRPGLECISEADLLNSVTV